MRKHFTKVLVERPRSGYRRGKVKGTLRDLQREPLEERAYRQSMRAPYKGDCRKESHEHLAPLRRYLVSQVGRPWDHVYSDLSRAVRKDPVNGRKLIDSLKWEVDQTVHYVDSAEGERELVGRWGYRISAEELYVDPESRLLCRADSRPRRRWAPRPILTAVVHDAMHRYVKLDEIWYFVTLAPIPGEEVKERPFDVVLKRAAFFEDRSPTYGNLFWRAWNGLLYAVSKRQANRKEVRRLNAGAFSENAHRNDRPARVKGERLPRRTRSR